MKKVFLMTVGAAVALLAMAIPFIWVFDLDTFFLEQLDPETSDLDWFQIGGLTLLVLAIDIFLPVPSSGVMTYCGAWFGDDVWSTWPAILICFAGMTASVLIGYGFSRFFGNPFVIRWSNTRDLGDAEAWMNRFGVSFLILLRGVPLLAEASVLVAGAYRMSFLKVLLATSIANLVYSTTYVLFGHFASQSDWLPTAVIISVLVPLFGLFMIRPKRTESKHS